MDFDKAVELLLHRAVSELHRDTADRGLDRLHDVVAGELAGTRELETLRAEVERFGDASAATRERIAAALRSTAAHDHDFEARLGAAIRDLGPSTWAPVTFTGGITSEGNTLAVGQINGSVHIGQPPHPPPAGPVARAAPGLPAIRSDIGVPAQVVGRKKELAALRSAFTRAENTGLPVVRTLTGLGGVGKTSLARAYAQRHHADYDVVHWIAAGDPSAVESQFRALLDDLAPGLADTAEDVVMAAHTQLGRCRGWLLVLDQLPDMGSLSDLVPPRGNGHVLVTTRHVDAGDRGGPVRVGPLRPKAAARLLVQLSGEDDRRAASALAGLLGHLPLALAQAGAFCGTTGMPLAEYATAYRDHPARLHRTGGLPDYGENVATTWELSFTRLSARAKALLTLLSFVAGDAIPIGVLLAPANPDEIAAPPELRDLMTDPVTRYDTAKELISYSLVTRCATPAMVNVHLLVQAVVRDRLENRVQPWLTTVKALLDAAWPTTPVTAVSTARWRLLRPHAQALLDHLRPDDPDALDLRHAMATWTGLTGDPAAARDQFTRLVDLHERVLGAAHPRTLAARGTLAHWTGVAGDPATARAQYADLLAARGLVLGDDHPDTLATLGKAAHWSFRAADVPEGLRLLTGLLRARERVLGPECPTTLASRQDVAGWTGRAGDAAGARDQLADLLAVRDRVLGPDHPDTLVTRHDWAYWTAEAGDPVEAHAQFAELLAVRERVLGRDHPDTLVTRHDKAYLAGRTGDVAGARDQFANLLTVRTRVLGPDHPDTLATRRHLDYWAERAR
ncbi:tetratricopeptide repeat protein [Umezawaea tangerina]|uniref:Tetratricopeptide repeat protein n=1 Tax=Umezawaea tangerina TaxID=84725 RepID=A0A2T0SGS6_9PSEU|nr:tetratricopeptide repeat protein [Umezawaea tangerina]PRY32605.1 tetratricopeptide repeat protein [Umezawaea tangerina]